MSSRKTKIGDKLEPLADKAIDYGVERVSKAAGNLAKGGVETLLGEDHIVAKAAGKAAEGVTKYGLGGAARKVTSMLFGDQLEPVRYEAVVHGGPEFDWYVREMSFVEGISTPYALSLVLLTEDWEATASVDELLGADLVLTFGRNGVFRVVCGVINEVGTIDVASDVLAVRVNVVPALASLAQRVDTRIFQNQTVPQILEEVLGAGLGEYSRKVDAALLNATYLPRDYCVQFKESDLEFCHRLMEEEGISYYFDVEVDAALETMVLVDHGPDRPNEDYPAIVAVIEDTVPIINKRPDLADTESIQHLEWSRPEQVTKVTTRQFNWKRPDPKAPPESEVEGQDPKGRVREIYIPDDRRRLEDRDGDASYVGTEVDEDEAPQTAKRFEMMSVERGRGEGSSNVTGFRAGGLFVIADHPHPDVAEAKLLLTRVAHFGEAAEEELGADSGGARYENSFVCVSAGAAFRPARSATKPKVYGAQTATVTGPASEEIHTDVHGRVKVKFHWDRLSPLDETSSCWVRVAQMWSGPGWGTWFLPRIGMEVVVQFLDGNPDRPLIVGCVYNGDNTPPYALPDHKTKTTIKSNSSIGGDGFNELRFEDMKNAEQIYVHAQKDYDEEVLNNRTRSVGSNETVTVEGNRELTVNGAPANGEGEFTGQKVSITGNETISVTGDRAISVGGDTTTTVSGSSSTSVSGGATSAVSGGQNFGVGKIDDKKPLEGGKMNLQAENEFTITCGASSLVLKSGGEVELTGTQFTFTSSGPVDIVGSLIKLN
ncbi:type VI secretion system Vgr family protein [Enhygromyxa salina]|uniref:Phage-related baseplate assembly protein n=1 Tax=Enhygromyxa salina TaxID=215803 RepID=A0A2S9Y5T3_9BACT|nr:type VI secretion system tip protein TssI/VgrG [Enhygromyxa salina]PRQ00463.1 Phage-related baseplate assembly protein [Enhygromyxa salina]